MMQFTKKRIISSFLIIIICALICMSAMGVMANKYSLSDLRYSTPFALFHYLNNKLQVQNSFYLTAIEFCRQRPEEYRRILFKNNYIASLLSRLYQNIFAYFGFYIMSILCLVILIVFMKKVIDWTQNGDGKKQRTVYAM